MKVNGWDDAPRPTIRGDAIEVLRRIGGGTVDQVAKELPQWSRKQIATGLAQAANKGLIPTHGKLPVEGLGKWLWPVIYGAPPEQPAAPLWKVRPFNSVFELGTRAYEGRQVGERVLAVLELLDRLGPTTRRELAPHMKGGDPSMYLRRAVSYGLAEVLPSPTYKTRYRVVHDWRERLEMPATPVKRDYGQVNSVFALGSMNGAATFAADR
jgi:hypothetical protein